MKKQIYDYTLKQLQDEMLLLNEKKFRATQIYEWLYQHCVESFDEMTNLSLSTRNHLIENFEIP